METIPNPLRGPHETPELSQPGDDVHEAPLPANDGAKDNFPSKTDLIDPDKGAGRFREKVR